MSTVELTLRMVVGLVLVTGLLLLFTRVAKHRFRLNTRLAALEVPHRHQLTKSSSVAVVRAGRRHFLIGVNDHAITLLAEGDDLVAAAPPFDLDAEDDHGAGDTTDPGTALDLDAEPSTDLLAVDGPGRPVAVGNSGRSVAPGRSAVNDNRPPQVVATTKGGARKRRRGSPRPTSSGMGVIEALRERSVRR